MKDIKQYFANGTKIVDDEIAVNLGNATEQKKQEQEEIAATGKRKRVKIRISRTNSKERMCNIIENKNDLIDKTPSPFNGLVNDSKTKLQNETPKSCLIGSNTKQCVKKDSKSTIELNENQSKNMKDISQDKKEVNKQIIVDLSDSNNSIKDVSNVSIELDDEIGSQREESNVFQVLMNRGKSIQYKLPPLQSIEDIECKEKSDDARQLRSKHKEKLLALADKKGYSKRKTAEIEEGERIEKNIENRIKFLKGENRYDEHKKDDNIVLPIKSKQLSGNLLNYFSKSPLGLINKDEKYVSTFIVKADVHRTDNSDTEPVIKPTPNKIYSNKKCSKSELDLSAVDDIHIVTSENFSTSQTTKQDKQKAHKPRWSLRIKLHSTEDKDFLDDTDDKLFSPRSKSKYNTSNKSRNSVNVEDNVDLKEYNEHIKTKVRNKEKKESISKQKEINILSTAKDAIIIDNDRNANPCLKESSDTDKMEEKINNTNKTVITVTDDSECEIINENILKRKLNEKLAPVFTKRRKTDSAVVAARRLFLQSEITDVENENTDYKVNNNSTFMLPFPVISHVTQLEDKSDSTKLEIKHKFLMKIERKYLPSIDVNSYKCVTNYMEAPKVTETIDGPVKGNFDRALSEMEKLCPDVRIMWKTISTIKGDSEKRSPPRTKGRKTKALEKKRILTESVESEEGQLHDCTWTCKYKPTSAQEIVGNEEAAGKLKNWLSCWRASLTRENDGSSGDEFYSSDCSSSYNNENNQVAVLLGPHGSGKSASVYAIAEELGYSVLEVNASSRRTGKRILKELEEATKSHRIKKNKHKSPFERIANESEASKISQNSLILLEDIDLIFEEDEGFVSAAYQLASNTKRPIVMTCRNTCPHLSKMAPQQNKIYFQKVDGNKVSVLLELISLTETGYRLPHNCLMKLLQMGDLRQALLQLQYLLLSGPPVLSEQSTRTKPSLWQDVQRYLYKPAIKLNRKHKTKKSTNTKKSNDTACILNDLAEDLDSLSLVSSLINIEDTTLNTENAQPNLSLAENMSFYSASRDLSTDIGIFISDQILYRNSNVNENVQNQSNIILKKQLYHGVDLALSHVTSACLDRRVMALDYLPTARTICRAEESRSTANYKRGNRFFHYLHSLKVPTVSMKPNILAAACRMLQEREDKTAPARIISITND